jgi:hypothetical protein
MDFYSLKKYLLPPGVILSVTLVGLILLGAMLYSRADRAQRFLEPALAISQPRSQFAIRFSELVERELDPRTAQQVLLMGNVLKVKKSSLFPEDFHTGDTTPLLVSIGRIFHSMLEDPQMSPYVNMILIVTRVPQSGDHAVNMERRHEALESTEKILNALFAVNPKLEEGHSINFACTARVGGTSEGGEDIIEFQIIPSERPHIDLLQKLEKYIR